MRRPPRARGRSQEVRFRQLRQLQRRDRQISLALAGFDPASKKYVGSDAVIKMQIAQIQADKKMPPEDKKEALDGLNAALKAPEQPVENKGNIYLAANYYANSPPSWAMISSNGRSILPRRQSSRRMPGRRGVLLASGTSSGASKNTSRA